MERCCYRFKTYRGHLQSTRQCPLYYESHWRCKFDLWVLQCLYICSPTSQALQIEHTFGLNIKENAYHVPLIRLRLTKALPILVPEVYDEVVAACNEYIPITEGNRPNHQNMFKKTNLTILIQTGLVFMPWIQWRKLSVGQATGFSWDYLFVRGFYLPLEY
jgi:hypothetical protein